jgi:hypothetical protein
VIEASGQKYIRKTPSNLLPCSTVDRMWSSNTLAPMHDGQTTILLKLHPEKNRRDQARPDAREERIMRSGDMMGRGSGCSRDFDLTGLETGNQRSGPGFGGLLDIARTGLTSKYRQ